MATKLAPREVGDLDPYKFMAVIGKRVIHPGGRASTEALLCRARITGSARVLPGHHGRGRGTARLRPEDGLAHAAHGQGRPLPRLHRDRRHQARMSM